MRVNEPLCPPHLLAHVADSCIRYPMIRASPVPLLPLTLAHSSWATLTFLLFLKHTRHVLISGLGTGCTLCLEGLPPEATWLLPSPTSSLCSNLTFSVSLIWQPCLKQQSHPLQIFMKPLSCCIFFTVPCTSCLIICFLDSGFLFLKVNFSSWVLGDFKVDVQTHEEHWICCQENS